MTWVTVSSWSYLCWLYRASPSSAAKNKINLNSVLTILWCPCVESSLVLLERVFAMTSALSWQNSVSIFPASFCTPKPNLPVTSGIPKLSTFAFQSPVIKRILSVCVLVLGSLVGHHRIVQLQPKQSWERRMELEESTCLTSGSNTKPQSSRQYGTGTKTEIQINGTK